jgi:hypothetical protein
MVNFLGGTMKTVKFDEKTGILRRLRESVFHGLRDPETGDEALRLKRQLDCLAQGSWESWRERISRGRIDQVVTAKLSRPHTPRS